MNIETITEEQAIDLVNTLSWKFRWNMAFLTEQDVKDEWKWETDRDITDEELENILTSYYWRKMDEYMIEDAMNGLRDAIYEVQNEES